MYNVIGNIIQHSWVTTNAGDQQYIYYICGALIIVFSAVLLDLIYRVFRNFWH